jgi:hypothetical protein
MNGCGFDYDMSVVGGGLGFGGDHGICLKIS